MKEGCPVKEGFVKEGVVVVFCCPHFALWPHFNVVFPHHWTRQLPAMGFGSIRFVSCFCLRWLLP